MFVIIFPPWDLKMANLIQLNISYKFQAGIVLAEDQKVHPTSCIGVLFGPVLTLTPILLQFLSKFLTENLRRFIFTVFGKHFIRVLQPAPAHLFLFLFNFLLPAFS